MDRLSFKSGELKSFIEKVEAKLGLDSNELAKLLGLSGRTIRDWKREKFKPTKDHILKISKLSGVQVPQYKILSPFWNASVAGRLGGRKAYELHGLLGTYESRVKGGVMSWNRRKKDPDLLKKYTNSFRKPVESSDFAEFIGIMLGDGSLTTYQCTIYLSSETDQEYAKYVKGLIKKLFGSTPSIYKHKKWKMLKVSISGVNLVKYLKFKGLYVGNKVHLQVGVPDWVWVKKGYIKACIRGLVDTDGCFSIHTYRVNEKRYFYPKLAFSNRSEPILQFVYQGLKQLGFNPKRTYKHGVWLHNQNEVRLYLQEIGTHNLKPAVKEILGGVA